MNGSNLVRGELWKSNGHVTLSGLVKGLLDHGFRMHRGHAKKDGSGGKVDTRQVMIVFDKETIEYNEEQLAHNALTAFTDEQRQELIDRFIEQVKSLVTIYGNAPIGRVPDHIYVKTGMPKQAQAGDPSLLIEDGDFIQTEGNRSRNVTFWDVLKEYEMVRVSFNIPPHLEHLIPDWMERRDRHERVEATTKIDEATAQL